jgi:hypothetical protein
MSLKRISHEVGVVDSTILHVERIRIASLYIVSTLYRVLSAYLLEFLACCSNLLNLEV